MSIDGKLRELMGAITSAERKVATALFADYPFAGLLTVAELSNRANVSSQTVLRLASKLGFDGYSDFQQAFIGEIKEGYHSPVILRETRGDGDSGDAFLSNLGESSIVAIRETAAMISDEQLDVISDLLSDQRRSIFFLGGRITFCLASYFFLHLRQIRPKTHMIPNSQEDWPEHLLRMTRNDIVLMFDFRRYQPDLFFFAERAAHDQKAKIVLITDKWISPIAKHSSHILPCAIDVGTPWDTGISALLLVEGLINKVSESNWPKTRKRIEKWDTFRISSTNLQTEEDQ